MKRREQILEAGLLLAQQSCIWDVTPGGVADFLDCSRPLIFYHFHSINELRRAIVAHAKTKGIALTTLV